MDRRRVIGALALAATYPPALAQRALPRIGYLTAVPRRSEFEDAFAEGLRDFGYVEGRSIAVDYRFDLGSEERMRAAVAELVERKVDILLATGTGVTRIAKSVTSTVPIVMTTAGDPVGGGVVASISRPGGNVTGYSMFSTELTRKRLQVFADGLPGLRRVAALFNERVGARPAFLRETEAAGGALGFEVVGAPAAIPEGVEAAFARARADGLQGVVILSDPSTITHRAALGNAGLSQRMPTMFANKLYMTGGGLMSYGPDILVAFRRTAWFVDRLLKGAKPGDLPIELASRFELSVSLRTASAIGVTLPAAFVDRADQVLR